MADDCSATRCQRYASRNEHRGRLFYPTYRRHNEWVPDLLKRELL